MAASNAEKLADLRFGLRAIDRTLATQRASKKSYEVSLASAKKSDNATAIGRLTNIIADLNKKIAANSKTQSELVAQINKLTKDVQKNQGPKPNPETTTKPKSTTSTTSSSASTNGQNVVTSPSEDEKPAQTVPSPVDTDNTVVDYNLPAVKDAYFRNMRLMANGRVGLISPEKTFVDDSNLYIYNSPTKVESAKELWTNTSAHKGMIQTYIPRNTTLKDIFPGLDADSVANLSGTEGVNVLKKYGFQFQYNPSDVAMSIGGTAAVDYMKYVNNPPRVIPDIPGASSISFSVIVNRMYDMTYLDDSGKLKTGLTMSAVYGMDKSTSSKELKQIYEKGTMYDVEFLLKTLIGFEVPTILRGTTADLGFLIGRLVELHLGNSLRYLVTINSIGVNHVLFDERMVPMYSTISISANRVPDFAPKAAEG